MSLVIFWFLALVLAVNGKRIPLQSFNIRDNHHDHHNHNRMEPFLTSPAPACLHLDCPEYTIVHEESDFQIRLYNESTWIKTSPISKLSFFQSTHFGFKRIFEYISGGNENLTHIEMTAPVLTSLVSHKGPFKSSAFEVLLPVASKWEKNPPKPLDELRLKIFTKEKTCIAVRNFGGMANDLTVDHQAKMLGDSLERSDWSFLLDRKSNEPYSVAQYNSPFEIIHRINEIWVTISTGDDVSDDCLIHDDHLHSSI